MDLKMFIEYGSAFLSLYSLVFFVVVFLQHRDKLGTHPAKVKKLPSVTIVIPAFNEEKTIGKTIESALEAEYPKGKKTIIVVDDGSTDRTLEIARKYEGPTVKVLHQKNAGKAAALNFALTQVRTDFVATLDSDSYIEKESLARMFAYFSEPQVAAVISTMKIWKEESFWQKLQSVEYGVMVFIREIQAMVDSVSVTPGPLSVFRTRVLKKLGGFDVTNILEDQEMALRLQKNNYKIKCATNAIVYTDAPRTFGDLMHQRIRWYRGGVRNFLSHYYLVSPKYGDFGMFAMPFAIISILMVIGVLGMTAYIFASGLPALAVESYFKYGWDAVLYSVTPLQLILFTLLLLVGAFSYMGLKYIRVESINAPMLLFYILFYSPIVLLFWAASFFQELRLARLKW